MSTQTKSYTMAMSELAEANKLIDSESFIEVSKNIGNNKFESNKTAISTLGNTMITTYSLYNNLNDIFNSMEHPLDIYFPPDMVEFKKNPYVHYETANDERNDFAGLQDNQLIIKSTLEEYMDNVGICIPVHGTDSNYYYYNADSQEWILDNNKKPTVLSYQLDSIYTIHSNLKFEYGNDNFFATSKVKAPKNIMLDVTGNIFLGKDYENTFYDTQHWIAGLCIDNKLITFTFLKNILYLNDNVIAQFHFKCPLANDTEFKIITNAVCQYFNDEDESDYTRKLYSGINAVNLAYYST